MKVFFVNLDKNQERLLHMKRLFEKHKIEAERFPAIYGKDLMPDERKCNFASLHSFLAMGRRMTDGEIGCALSHCGIYRKMAEECVPYALILEDDLQINDNIHTALQQVEAHVNVNLPEVYILSSHGMSIIKDAGVDAIRNAMCTDAYVITCAAARMILSSNYPVVTVADKWNRWVKRNGLRLYRVGPTAVTQDNTSFGTDINTANFHKHSGIQWLVRKAIRVPEVFIDWLWFKLLGAD